MKLTDLDPHFIKRSDRFEYDYTDDVTKAEGLVMKCPACHWAFTRHRGGDDVHSITFGKPTLEDVFVRLTGRRLFADERETEA